MAAMYAWRYGDRYAGGVFLVSARSPERLRSELAGLAGRRLFDLPEQQEE